MPTVRYVVAALALGLVAVWASETLFWVAPDPGLTALAWVGTWLVYAAASGASLSAVLWAGVRGWPAAFLGGALLGIVVEGVIVATMYDAFPAQLVWTPLAWHGLVTGGAVLALSRSGASLERRMALWAALGVAVAAWAQYWGAATGVRLGEGAMMATLAGGALTVAGANVVLDRLGTLARPGGVALLALPAVLATLWAVQTVLVPDSRRVAGPLMAAALVWTMRRLGTPGDLPLGGPRRPAQHLAVLVLPLVAVPLAALVQRHGPDLSGSNIAVALATGIASLVALGILAGRALRAPRDRPSRESPGGGGP